MGTLQSIHKPAFFLFTTFTVFAFTLSCACSGVKLVGEGDGEDTALPADGRDGVDGLDSGTDGREDGSGSDVPQDEWEDSPDLIVNHTWSIILGTDHEYDWFVEVIKARDGGYFVAAKLVEPEPEEEEYHLQLLLIDEDGSIL